MKWISVQMHLALRPGVASGIPKKSQQALLAYRAMEIDLLWDSLNCVSKPQW